MRELRKSNVYSSPHNAAGRAKRPGSAGQSLIESCIVIGILCILFVGLFQLSQLFMAREILNHTAARGARAQAVGFNSFMVFKSVRTASIPNAGRMLVPEPEGGPAMQWMQERWRIPIYLGATWHSRLSSVLQYENWHGISYSSSEGSMPPMLSFNVWQDFPLRFRLFRIFYRPDSIRLRGKADIDNHYQLYLDATAAAPDES